MPVVGTIYPSLETLLNLVRVRLNDTFKGVTGTAGEGRVFVDSAPFILPLVNSALSKYQRDLDNAGVPTKITEVFLTNFPPVNGPSGVGVPDPAVQQNLNYSGFFDGFVNYDTPALPSDLLVPKDIWERSTGTGLSFTPVAHAVGGPLLSCNQNFSIGNWDWRGDAIFWNGALVAKDIRLRYVSQISFFEGLNPTDFPTTPLPFRESIDCLAYAVAEDFAASRLPPGATADLQTKYKTELDKIINRQVRGMQGTSWRRVGYGEDDSSDGIGWY